MADRPENQVPTTPNAGHPRLTACILVCHQVSGLDKCLKSVSGVADEIVIVTTRDPSEIQPLAAAAGASIVSKRWRNSFSAVRNAALEAATGEWMLSLDADEWLEPSAARQIKRAIRQSTFDGWLISTRNILEPDAQGECFVRSQCRLFKRDARFRFERAVCESVEPSIRAAGGEVAPLPGAMITGGAALVRPGQRDWDVGLRLHLITRELRRHPNDPDLLLGLALQYYSSGSFALAEQALDNARRLIDRSFHSAALVYSLLVVCLREMGNTDRGLAVSLEARSAGISSPELDFATAWTHMARREFGEAMLRFAACLEPDSPKTAPRSADPTISSYRADMGLALAMVGTGQVKAALPHASRAVDGAPRRPESWVLLGCVYHLMGRAPESRRALEQALKLDPSHADALGLVLPLYQEARQFDKALATVDTLIKVRGRLPELIIRRAAVLCDSGNFAAAASEVEAALKIAPDVAETQMDAGRILASCGRHTEALACFSRAIELAPDQAYPRFGAGDLFYKLGAYQDAVEAYRIAVKLDPGNAPGYFALGNACIKCGYLEPAIRSWERAVELRPGYEEAKNNLKIARSTLARAA